MPGRFGNKKVSVKSLEVIKIDENNNKMLVKGSIPGAPNGIVIITM
jgi:large subunit ribosomal protein L3